MEPASCSRAEFTSLLTCQRDNMRGWGLDDTADGAHTMHRTKASLIYRRTKNLRAVQLLLGNTKLESTVRYLGIEVDDALERRNKQAHFQRRGMLHATTREEGASALMPHSTSWRVGRRVAWSAFSSHTRCRRPVVRRCRTIEPQAVHRPTAGVCSSKTPPDIRQPWSPAVLRPVRRRPIRFDPDNGPVHPSAHIPESTPTARVLSVCS
ncbi:hypothetical protein QFZ94_008085 [Paraburkholderia sp. JPY465]